MPLPTNEKVLETSNGLLSTLKGIFGPHPGFRPAHAKGRLLKGTFTPTAAAGALSKAQHFTSPSTPALARFSSSTGIPQLPDDNANGNPRGLAVRFELASQPRRVHTDIVAHSVPLFPGVTGDDALAFFRSLTDGSVGDYVASHPVARRFVEAPKPFPESFATDAYYAIHAYRLVAADGKGTFVRYRWVPSAGVKHITPEEATARGGGYLFDGLPGLLEKGPISFKLVAQVAAEGDVTDDSSQLWPEDRELVELGTLSLDAEVPQEEDAAQQKTVIFDPIPRVEGIEPSADPLLDVRAALYLISGRERRAV